MDTQPEQEACAPRDAHVPETNPADIGIEQTLEPPRKRPRQECEQGKQPEQQLVTLASPSTQLQTVGCEPNAHIEACQREVSALAQAAEPTLPQADCQPNCGTSVQFADVPTAAQVGDAATAEYDATAAAQLPDRPRRRSKAEAKALVKAHNKAQQQAKVQAKKAKAQAKAQAKSQAKAHARTLSKADALKLAQKAGARSAACSAEQGNRDHETHANNFDLRAAVYRQGPTPDEPFGAPFLQPVRVFWDAENIRFNQMWYAALQTALAGRGRIAALEVFASGEQAAHLCDVAGRPFRPPGAMLHTVVDAGSNVKNKTDMTLALDALYAAFEFPGHVFMIVSEDKDYEPLVLKLQRMGVVTVVVTARGTGRGLVGSYTTAADSWIDLNDHLPYLQPPQQQFKPLRQDNLDNMDPVSLDANAAAAQQQPLPSQPPSPSQALPLQHQPELQQPQLGLPTTAACASAVAPSHLPLDPLQATRNNSPHRRLQKGDHQFTFSRSAKPPVDLGGDPDREAGATDEQELNNETQVDDEADGAYEDEQPVPSLWENAESEPQSADNHDHAATHETGNQDAEHHINSSTALGATQAMHFAQDMHTLLGEVHCEVHRQQSLRQCESDAADGGADVYYVRPQQEGRAQQQEHIIARPQQQQEVERQRGETQQGQAQQPQEQQQDQTQQAQLCQQQRHQILNSELQQQQQQPLQQSQQQTPQPPLSPRLEQQQQVQQSQHAGSPVQKRPSQNPHLMNNTPAQWLQPQGQQSAECNLQQLQQKRHRARKRKRAQAIHLAKPDPSPHATFAAATVAGESTQGQVVYNSWAESEVLAHSPSYQAAARQNPVIPAATSRARATAKERAPDAAKPANASKQPVATGCSVMSFQQIGERLKAPFLPAESPDPRALASAAVAEQEAAVCTTDVQPDANPPSTLHQPFNRSTNLHQPGVNHPSTTESTLHQPLNRSSFDLRQPDANPVAVAALPAGTRMLNESNRLLVMQHPERVIIPPAAVAKAKMFAGPSFRPAVSAAFPATPAMLAEMAKDTDGLLQGHLQPHTERGSDRSAENTAHRTHRAADPLAAQACAGASQHDGDAAMHPQDQREDMAARDSTKSAAGSEHHATNPGQSNPENPESRENPQNAPQLLENTDSREPGATGARETSTHKSSQIQPSAALPHPPAREHPDSAAGPGKRHSENTRAASDNPEERQGGQRGAAEGGTATATMAGGSENASASAVCATLAVDTDKAARDNAAAPASPQQPADASAPPENPENLEKPENDADSRKNDGLGAFKMFQVEFWPVVSSQLTSAGDDGREGFESPPCNGSGSEDERAAEVAEYLKDIAGLEKRRAASAPRNDYTNPKHRKVSISQEDANALTKQSAGEHPENESVAEEKQASKEDQANLSQQTTAVPNDVAAKTQQLAAVLAGTALHHSNHAAEKADVHPARRHMKSAQDHQAGVPADNPNVVCRVHASLQPHDASAPAQIADDKGETKDANEVAVQHVEASGGSPLVPEELGHEEQEETRNSEPEGTVAASLSKRKLARKPERNVERVMRSGRKFQYL